MKTKPRFTILLLTILTLSSIWMLPLANTMVPPEVPGGGTYYSDYGLLDTDTYLLYPWEDTSIQVGFSKYGELIDANMGLGLKYDGVDVFASSMVPIQDWCSGWIMDIHYTQGGYLRNTWAYALFSDRTVAGVGGDWQNHQLTKDASDPADTHGGRRTNGYAESEPIRLIYDGPREAIYLLNTTIYDKDKDQLGVPLVRLTIQLVFNKVKKYVVEIKDIKRIDDNKMDGPFQIEFSQRAEWDLGLSTAPRCYAEFYDNLTTKYIKHPFYYPEGGVPANYDLCQIIGAPSNPMENKLVGFAAFWPPLISKWVTETYNVRRLSNDVDVPSLLATMETYEHEAQLPTSADDLVDPWIYYNDLTGEIVILLPKEPVAYPRGEGQWEMAPWVFREEPNGEFAKLFRQTTTTPGQWYWNETFGPYGAVVIKPFQWSWGDNFKVVYKRFMKGNTPQMSEALDCMEPLFEPGDTILTYGMNEEPDTPYVFGEWDFDLDLDHPENSTHQFRCVSVYGVTDLHNGVDPDMPEGVEDGYFRIDSEVLYQLDEVFNPIDLKDVAHKDTFRWCQKGTATQTIVLEAHLYDKYSNPRDCLENHTIVFPEKWGYYCRDSEKVILMDSMGVNPDKLLIRDTDYTVDTDTIVINPSALVGYDRYKVLYTTMLCDRESDWHDGRWEWTIIGDFAKPSDSLGAAMLTVSWSDWKNKEVWLSGLDIRSTDLAPSIPWVMQNYAPLDGETRDSYYMDPPDDLRAGFRDDWSTPDDWMGETVYPYAISSSNILVVGGPLANLAAEYFNDFTDAKIFTEYGAGFYATGCWARTVLDHYVGKNWVDVPDNELWYSSDNVEDDVGYALISTYKDLNETVGFIVYGYTAEDTYYACYALRGGLLDWLQYVQDGTTSIILEIDYSDLHPVQFHVAEAVGLFTECTGFMTNFKTSEYYVNYAEAMEMVESNAEMLGLCYKLVDIDWCAQVHPDP